MSMMFCPHCGNNMSSQAPVCPHCGTENDYYEGKISKKDSNLKIIIIAIAVVILVIATPFIIFTGIKKDNKNKDTSTLKRNNEANKMLNNTTQAAKLNVSLKVESDNNIYFGTYLVDVSVDDQVIFSINDGAAKDTNLILEPGIHKIRFTRNDDKEFFTEVSEVLDSDCTLSYFINCHSAAGGGIKVKKIENKGGK